MYGSLSRPSSLARPRVTGTRRPSAETAGALGCRSYVLHLLWHSVPECFALGAFGAKMLLLRPERSPGLRLPVLPTFGVTT
ncbi:DUF6529 family protein [Streptomyces sp. NPDC001443]